MRTVPPLHPGAILAEEFMAPLGITQYRLAKDIKVPETRIAAILKGKRRITPDSALRMSRYFRMSDRFFSNLSGTLRHRNREDEVGRRPGTRSRAARRYWRRGPSALVSAQQPPGNDLGLDFGGAFEDVEDARVDQHPADGELLGVAVAAVDLQGVIGA